MPLTAADFWNARELVSTQNPEKAFLYWHETELLKSASAFWGDPAAIRSVHVVGCGTGREIPGIREFLPRAQIIASDIAPNMIELCRSRMSRSALENIQTTVCGANEIDTLARDTDAVICFNNMLTYVLPAADRAATLSAFARALRPSGFLLAAVHHQYGAPEKTAYFLLRQVLSFLGLLRSEAGDRVFTSEGCRSTAHYFTAHELSRELHSAGFEVLQIESLRQLSHRLGRPYPIRGYNNLLCVARKI